MIEAFLAGIGEVVSNFGNILTGAFEAVSGFFVVPGATEGTYNLTLLGSVTAIALGVSVLTFIISLVMKIIRGVKLRG